MYFLYKSFYKNPSWLGSSHLVCLSFKAKETSGQYKCLTEQNKRPIKQQLPTIQKIMKNLPFELNSYFKILILW